MSGSPTGSRLHPLLLLMLAWACTGRPAPPPGAEVAAPSTQLLKLSGTVIDRGGALLAGAKVHLAPVMHNYEAYDRWLVNVEKGLWAEPVATAVTTADGRYAFEVTPGRQWRLTVEHPDRGMLTRHVEPLYGDRQMPVVKLRPAHPLEVRVKTTTGVAVVGARVMATADAFSVDAWHHSWVAGITDDDGRVRLHLPTAHPGHLEVAAPGLVPLLGEHDGTGVANVVLLEGARLELRLQLPAGEPAAAAVVYRPLTGLTLAKADATGQVALLGEPGSHQLTRFLAADGAALEVEVEFPAGGQPAPTTLELLPPTLLPVRVVVAGSLEPVPGAVAWIQDDRVVFGDSEGRLTLTVPASQTWISLSVAAPGHLYQQQRRISVAMARGQTMTVGLKPAAGLRGRVTDADGRPLADVILGVMAESDRSNSYPRHWLFPDGRESRSAADGSFTITPLPSGERLSLVARRAGYTTHFLDLDALRPHQTKDGVDLVLTAGRSAIGTVVDEAMRPIAGASVEYSRWRRAAGPSDRDRSLGLAFTEPAIVTGGDGRFELRDLGSGSFDLEVSAAGFVAAKVRGMRLSAASSPEDTSPEDIGTVTLQRGARIAGEVVDEGGLPVAGAQVHLSPAGDSPGTVWDRTASNRVGSFEFVDRPAGSYQLRAHADGFVGTESGRLETPLEAPVMLVMRRGATLGGRVLDEKSNPIAGAQVSSYQKSDVFYLSKATSGKDGRFELGGLTLAEHRLFFKAPGFRPQSREVQLSPDVDVEPLAVVLEQGATVSGQVSWPDGRPVSGVSVRLLVLDGSHEAAGYTDSNGQFELGGVPIGPAAVRLSWTQIREKVEVRLGPNRVSFTLAGVEVSGRVRDAAGRPVPSARVTLRPSMLGGWLAIALSDEDGRFTLADIVPGDHRLEVQHPEYAAYRSMSRFEVAAKPIDGLEVRLNRGAVVSGRLEGFDTETLPLTGVELRGRVLQGGRGVANAQVEVGSRGSSITTHTAEDGTFVLRGVAEGPQQMSVEVFVGRGHRRQIDVREGREVIVELPTGEISGRVREAESGEPLSGVEIDLSPLDDYLPIKQWYHRPPRSTRSDANGDFSLSTVESGDYYLSVQHQGYGLLLTELEIGSAPLHGVDFELSPSEGMILDVSHEDGSEVGSVEVVMLDGAGRIVLHSETPASADGKFRFAGAPTGSWQVWLITNPEVSVRPTLTPERSFLPSAGVDRRLRAFLETRSSAPASGAQTPSSGPAWESFSARVPGETAVVLSAGASVHFTVAGLEADLETSDTFSVELRDAEGLTLPDLHGVGRFVGLVGGSYVEGLWPGQWTLDLHHPDGRNWSASFTARAGETIELELQSQPPAPTTPRPSRRNE